MKSSTSGLRETRELLCCVRCGKKSRSDGPTRNSRPCKQTPAEQRWCFRKEAPRNDNFALWCDLSRLGERSANRTYKEEGLRGFYKNIDEAQGESRLVERLEATRIVLGRKETMRVGKETP